MTQIGDSANTAPPQPPATAVGGSAGRPRWVRRVVVAGLVVVLLLVVATAGVGYYFSSVLLTVDNSVSYPVTVKSVDGSTVVLSRDDDTELPAVLGLIWPEGSAVLSATVEVRADEVVRTVATAGTGTLAAGLRVAADIRVYGSDPKAADGLDFDSVTIPGELGDLPAWYVKPTSSPASGTWVIAVHGLGASRTETLRALPIIAKTGMPALSIAYRNDVGAPASPDGYYHLGDTEWRDVGSAITYAHAHGATGVILYAWSMGGALSMTALRRLPAGDAGLIKGLVMDSANFDWNAILEYQGSQRGLPGFVTWTAKRFIEARADLTLADFDQRPYAPQLAVPMLVFVDHSDKTVPNEPAVEFAQSRRDLVTLVQTTGGGHTGSWNADPTRYASEVTTFLDKVKAK